MLHYDVSSTTIILNLFIYMEEAVIIGIIGGGIGNIGISIGIGLPASL